MEMVVPAGQDMATRQDVEASTGRFRSVMQIRSVVLEERMSHLSTRSFVLVPQVWGSPLRPGRRAVLPLSDRTLRSPDRSPDPLGCRESARGSASACCSEGLVVDLP